MSISERGVCYGRISGLVGQWSWMRAASGRWTGKGERVDLFGNFFPGKWQEQAKRWFMEQAPDNPRRSLAEDVAQRIPERFAEALCIHIECDPQNAIAQLPQEISGSSDRST